MYLIEIDFSFIFHKSYSVINYYYQPKNPDTGKPIPLDLTIKENRGYMIRKVLIDLCAMINELGADEVVFCFDAISFRYDLLEDYKGGRGDKVEGFQETIQEVYEILTNRGFNALKIDGLEGDDLLGLVATDPRFSKFTKIITTRDADMKQLINEKTFVYDPTSKSKIFYYAFDSQIKFKPKEGEEYSYIKVDPFHLLFTKIMKGCSGDKIPQLTPKGYRFAKIDKMYGNLLGNLDNIESLDEGLFKAMNSLDLKIEKDVFEKQMKLICISGEYLPDGKQQEYYDSFELKKTEIPFDMYAILNGTEYVTEEYKK